MFYESQQLEVSEEEKNKIKLNPWGLRVNMTSKLSKFTVTSCEHEVHPNKFYLVFSLRRLSGPFWFSLFIPSICLILAAEVALFLDEAHFDALIMVALTSNLVMYTLYSSVQAELPKDSSLKLVDVWLLHGLLMPMIVFVTLAINELINSRSTEISKNIKIADHTVVVSGQKNFDNPSGINKIKTCMHICKSIIPIVSVVFIVTFFFICQ